MTSSPIQIREVAHRYGSSVALQSTTLDIPTGCVVGLVGPDGVGKSTLLGLIAGVRRIQNGAVALLGGDIGDPEHRAALRPRIAYMPQGLGRNLYPTLSAFENVDFFARLYGQNGLDRADRIKALFDATGLGPFADRPAGKLSGGMKQKLALCCALIHDPDLLILDEPTTGIDPLSRRQFWNLIESIRARSTGMSVVVATAYMSEAEGFDHLIAMNAGLVLAQGTPADLMAGADTLEAAYVALLPEVQHRENHAVAIPPRVVIDGPPAIEAEGLTMQFGDFTAVDNVSFRISQGEIFGFLGSNGCGKTTTMKMLTGLLTPTEGSAYLFGAPVGADGMAARKRVGYMSQSFSLYGELTVRGNLDLHAALFHLPQAQRAIRIDELLDRFGLRKVADALPKSLSLGLRQRLQLATAVLHKPEMLILDEPTSGVDPVARDQFWDMLTELSRRDGVTIFISTHFMNEAERCDRISLMHAGKVLAEGAPHDLCVARDTDTLEDAFVGYMTDAGADGDGATQISTLPAPVTRQRAAFGTAARIWAFAWRETLELMRDPIRLGFALLGPLALMLAMGFGITFDVENLSYAVLDQDQSRESRILDDAFSNSRFFRQNPPIRDLDDLDQRMLEGQIATALVIPPNFGRDLLAGRGAKLGVWLDGSNTIRAETARGFVQGVVQNQLRDLMQRETGVAPDMTLARIVEPRFRYNQAFQSQYAIPPGVLMLLLIMIPAMLTALGVVREKELGSIVNLYAAPARSIEFLLGKQLPYVAVAMASFASLIAMMVAVFGVPLPSSPLALILGALVYTLAATSFGLLVSCFVQTQIAAIFATAILLVVPVINFSGMLYPVSTLGAGTSLIGQGFPAFYFQRISTGVFNKGLDLAALWPNHLVLGLFYLGFLGLAALLLRQQEA